MSDKADQVHSPAHLHRGSQRMRYKLMRSIPFVIVFFLGYAFGLLFYNPSSPRISGNSPPCSMSDEANNQRQRPLQQQQKPPNDTFEFLTECAPPIPHSQVVPTISAKLYNNTSPYLDFPPPHLRPFLQRRRVRGWGSTTSVFETLIRSTRPKTIIEVGTFLGASTLHMAEITRTLGLPNTVILCLDDFRGWPGFRELENGVFRHLVDVNGDVTLMQQFMQNVVDAGEQSRILPVPFSTTAGLEALCQWGVYGDLVEVDASHDFHSAWDDINRAWKVVRPGGVMFGHDYNLDRHSYGVKRAVHLFAKVKGLDVRPDGEHWVLAPPKPLPTISNP